MAEPTTKPDDGKRKIKKLTKEKIQEFLPEAQKPNGLVDFSGRGIETVLSFEGLDGATKLDLSRNKLTKLTNMKTVSKLTMLKLMENKLNGEGLAELRHLRNLVTLNIADNVVLRIPTDVLRHMSQLKALVLNNNSITTLEWIPKLSELPDLSSLKNITELRFSHNKLKTIPKSLAQLPKLKILELGHNQIDEWDGIEALSKLDSLKQLSLTGNPIYGVPLDASKATEAEAKEDLSADEKSKLKEAKRLEAKHKQYNFKMKRLFPNLVIRDGHRVLSKKVHGYVAPPKEEKEKAKEKTKKERPLKQDKKKKAEADSSSGRKRKHHEGSVEQSSANIEKPEKKSKHQTPSPATDENDVHMSESTSAPAEKPTPKVDKSTSTPSKKQKKETAVNEETMAKASKDDDKKKKKQQQKSKSKEKKAERQPKDIASGVVAVKHFKKPKTHKASSSSAAVEPVNIAEVSFTPNVGLGGSSAWD
ncbi:hypothetical protein ATCC90586_010071 [Pythium insidiosum]|nr:hypothetical protein ATCC90586_010071 [Pythium insidiosum]